MDERRIYLLLILLMTMLLAAFQTVAYYDHQVTVEALKAGLVKDLNGRWVRTAGRGSDQMPEVASE